MHLSRKNIWLPALCLLWFGASYLEAQDASNQLDYTLEDASRIGTGNIYFPKSVESDGVVAVVYQDVNFITSDSGSISLSAAIYRNGTWGTVSRFIDPIEFVREAPPEIFSAAFGRNGLLVVAHASDANTITIHQLDTSAAVITATELSQLQAADTVVAPRLFRRPNGSIICFVSSLESSRDRITPLFAISTNGQNWSSFRKFGSTTINQANFLPAYTALGNREVIVYQNLMIGESSTYQLFLQYTDNNGSSWSRPKRITNVRLPYEEGRVDEYDNQRATLVSYRENIGVAWERKRRGEAPRVFYAAVDRGGTIIDEPVLISSLSDSATSPAFAVLGNELYLAWNSETRNRRSTQIARQTLSGNWVSSTISGTRESVFPNVVANGTEQLFVSWLENVDGTNRRLINNRITLPTDTIRLVGNNFSIGRPSNQTLPQLSWELPETIGQLSQLRYSWSKDEVGSIKKAITLPTTQRSVRIIADSEGDWYFKLFPIDTFGNPIEIDAVQYTHDRTAPSAPLISGIDTDARGFLPSNTFTVQWDSALNDDIAGYFVDLKRVGRETSQISTVTQPDDTENFTSTTTEKSLSVQNIDNGLWELVVAAVDRAGNSSEANRQYLRLNKYVPVTLIFSINSSPSDADGQESITISGRGFLSDGAITTCIFDRDRALPYDYTFAADSGNCNVNSDTRIAGITSTAINSGQYYVGLTHNKRGVTFSSSAFELLSTGTVIFGDFTTDFAALTVGGQPGILGGALSQIGSWPFYLAIIALIILSIILVFRLFATIAEGRSYREELQALVAGRGIQYTDKEYMQQIRKLEIRGIGLRVKFTLFITLLVVAVILTISSILGGTSLNRQERILADGLQQRIDVLLDSVANQASVVFLDPVNLVAELRPLADQAVVLNEAEYVTITGQNRQADAYNTVWATSDLAILDYNANTTADNLLSTPTFQAGNSTLNDAVSPLIDMLRQQLNTEITDGVESIPSDIIDINRRIVAVITQSGGNLDANAGTLSDLDTQLASLTQELNTVLRTVNGTTFSTPVFDPLRLDRKNTNYTFYRPIVGWSGSAVALSGEYYQGMIRIGISTENLITELNAARREIIITTLIIAIVAMIVGFIGSSILATVVVAPISKVVKGVEVISQTDDKSELRDHTIKVKSKDELSLLAQRVNAMTEGLVKASDANKELIVGKEVQKLFIPLQKDEAGKKLSIASDSYGDIDFAGYYEGAHGVSGDYFSYSQLDDNNVALIKCDVSGKGIPAALIMVEVATIFYSYVRSYSMGNTSTSLVELVAGISDTLESMQFEGRFAALTVATINQQTGQVRICSAGDNQIHIYRSKTQSVEVIDLPIKPAAGIFPSSLIPEGYQERQANLEKGDALILFTDGVDESRRYIRDAQLNIQNDAENKSMVEEFGIQRLHDVITCLAAGKQYQLQRQDEPYSKSPAIIDLSNQKMDAMSIVKSVIVAEKLFRLYRAENAGTTPNAPTSVVIDKQILPFVQECFNNADVYLANESPTTNPHYARFDNLIEETQYDDLTILIAMRT